MDKLPWLRAPGEQSHASLVVYIVMAATATLVSLTPVTRAACMASGVKPVAARPSLLACNPARRAKMSAPRARQSVRAQASMVELAQIAGAGAEIAEVASTCFVITLVGLAIGFVLLRVEASVQGDAE